MVEGRVNVDSEGSGIASGGSYLQNEKGRRLYPFENRGGFFFNFSVFFGILNSFCAVANTMN